MNDSESTARHNVPAAQRLRLQQTSSEAVLWECLRNRRFRRLKFRRQHPIGRFVLDFYCPERRLAVEIDGPVHENPEQRVADLERQRIIESQGIEFMRVSSADVVDHPGRVLRRLSAWLDGPGAPLRPQMERGWGEARAPLSEN